MLAPFIAVAIWLLWVPVAHAILRNPRGDVRTGLLYHFVRAYAFLVQRASASGLEGIPRSRTPGPLILVANHTAGVDPMLIQAFLAFEPRWMMGRDMMIEPLRWLWNHLSIIAVSRDGSDTSSAREALRHIKSGGVLGLFPEGGIERPARTLRPFLPGIGLIIARSGAPVIPVFIEGTPESRSAFGSFAKLGNARLVFGPVMRFGRRPAPEITAELEAWFAAVSGWPRVEQTLWDRGVPDDV
ncbi:MAG: lysophospholipid acyltransferase family protein [Phycisphaerales bacterium]